MPGDVDMLKTLLGAPEPVNWLFAGDSITQGSLHTMGWRDYTELFAERIGWELSRRRDCVIRTAVSGWRIDDLEADLAWSVLAARRVDRGGNERLYRRRGRGRTVRRAVPSGDR